MASDLEWDRSLRDCDRNCFCSALWRSASVMGGVTPARVAKRLNWGVSWPPTRTWTFTILAKPVAVDGLVVKDCERNVCWQITSEMQGFTITWTGIWPRRGGGIPTWKGWGCSLSYLGVKSQILVLLRVFRTKGYYFLAVKVSFRLQIKLESRD